MTSSEGLRKSKRYRIYIDESGDHTYKKVDVLPSRYLGITGILVEAEEYRNNFHPDVEKLKQKHFPHNPDTPVILHRNDILNKRGPFWRLRDEDSSDKFNIDLLYFFEKSAYKIITIVIDKKGHQETYGIAAFHPYHFCITAILERYCGFLHYFNAIGDVMVESRGTKEDIELQSGYTQNFLNGTFYRNKKFFQDVLTSNKPKFVKKKDNISGIQIADLLAFPCKQELLKSKGVVPKEEGVFGEKICAVIQTKYNRRYDTGYTSGYGKIFLGFK